MLTIVKGGHLLDLELDFAPGDLLIDGDVIKRVGGAIVQAGAEVIDARGMVGMPGLINAMNPDEVLDLMAFLRSGVK